jgi:ADP-ribose pyrophosphatase YjhB (NUDIX family)
MAAPDYRYCPRCGGALAHRSIKAGDPDRLVCTACEFVFYLDPKVAAGILVQTAGGLLLLRRGIEPGYGRWVFPGGFVDRGEHPEEAALREAREEAGILVAIRGLMGIYQAPPGNPVVLIVYRGDLLDGEPTALDESLEARLFPPAAIPWEELAFPTTRMAVRDYVRWLDERGGAG